MPLKQQATSFSSVYSSGPFTQNKPLDLTSVRESLLKAEQPLSLTESEHLSSQFETLKHHALSTNKQLNHLTEQLSNILLVLNTSQKKLCPATSPEKLTTISSHYSHLSAITPTSARHRPASEADTNRYEGRNDGNYNGYGMKGLDDKHDVGDRNGEEHEHDYYQGPLPPSTVTLSVLFLHFSPNPSPLTPHLHLTPHPQHSNSLTFSLNNVI